MHEVQMIEEIRGFYCAYQEWLDLGAPEWKPFYRTAGLCHNLTRYLKLRGLQKNNDIVAIQREMYAQFVEAGLDRLYPFNESRGDYALECKFKKCHVNERRVKWVREHAAEITNTLKERRFGA